MKKNIYAEVTAQVINGIADSDGNFTLPWHRPALNALPKNALTGRSYNGMNCLSLWVAAQSSSYQHGIWATFRQWSQLGAQVQSGEKGSLIIFYRLMKTEASASSEERVFPLVKYAYVFNVEQVTGFEAPQPFRQEALFQLSPEIDSAIARTGINIEHRGESAFYIPKRDSIVMPPVELFKGSKTSSPYEAYYSTVFHELIHATGAPHRLNRKLSTDSASREYHFEEIIAELGAAFCCARLGISSSPRTDHAQYIKSYIELLKADEKAIVKAASAAQLACEYLIPSADEQTDDVLEAA